MRQNDLLLLTNLRKNARATLTKISRNTQIPVSTIFDRLKANEGTIIRKHTAILDFNQLGFTTRATIIYKFAKSDKKNARQFLTSHQNINSVYKINNGYDFLVEAIFRNILELENFLEKIDETFRVKSKQTYYIIEEIKREEFLSDPKTIDLVCSNTMEIPTCAP